MSDNGGQGDLKEVRIGFIPLIDCALLAVAAEKGFAEAAGLRLILSREPSWAAIRDKVAFGLLDAAHMLAGMPLALTLGIGELKIPTIAAMSLGQGGNAITVSRDLHAQMLAADPQAMAGPRAFSARALAKVVEQRRDMGQDPVKLASVFPVSSHNYELRYWLAAAGLDPDHDVSLAVIPPPRMVENLVSGHIDGFCVGEPWNQLAVAEGLGRIVATKHDIWPASPEKVLGLREDWAEANRDTVFALIRALVAAACWADRPENRPELAEILARPEYLDLPAALLLPPLQGRPLAGPGAPLDLPRYHVFHDGAATFPWVSQGEWLIGQMIRWGQIAPENCDRGAAARRVFRADLYRAALAGSPDPIPAEDTKLEGAHSSDYALPAYPGGRITMRADALFDRQ